MARPRPWGWHQLDARWATRLVADADLPPRSLVLDVGAGTGALVVPLLAAGHQVIAVEAHPTRAVTLRQRFGNEVTIVQADAADLRLPRRPFHVVANPPYAITTALLRRLLAPGSRLVTAELVLQEQAARRWSAPTAPGYGRWSMAFAAELGRPVPRRAFDPPPPVPSRVLCLHRR